MLVIACGAIAKEILELKRLNHWDFRLRCVPAQLHNAPKRIPAAVEQEILKAQAHHEKIFVAFADCGTGGQLDSMLAKYSVERLPGAHCYQFFAGQERFLALHEQELGTFYLTDFLLRHFDAFIIKGLALDRPGMQEMIFGNYTRLLYLAQNPSEDLLEQARVAAAHLGLRFEVLYTGYGELGSSLQQAVKEGVLHAI